MYKNKSKGIKRIVIFFAILFVFLMGFNYVKKLTTTKEISYNEFINLVDENQVSQIVITDKEITITPRDNSEYKGKILYTPNINDKNLIPKLQELKVNHSSIKTKEKPVFGIIIALIIIIIIMSFIGITWRSKSFKKDKKRLLTQIRDLENKK